MRQGHIFAEFKKSILGIYKDLTLYTGKTTVPEFIDPRFRENKPKTLVFSHRKRAFWACFRENCVYNFGHCCIHEKVKKKENGKTPTALFVHT